MAEPSPALWEGLLDLSRRAIDQFPMWRCELDNASLSWSGQGGIVVRGQPSAGDLETLGLFEPLLGRRWVIAQLGQSLDGRIATATGDSYYINGPETRAHLHRLRALADAVLIGAGTAIADRPALTVRHVPGPDPVPIILDPSARVEAIGPLFDPRHTPRLLILTGREGRRGDWPDHVEVVKLPLVDGQFDPARIIDCLSLRGLDRLLVEGGGVTVSRFIDADVLDRLHLLIAPLLIGSGPAGLALAPIERLAEARRPPMRAYRLADELVVDLDLSCSSTAAPGRAPTATTTP